MTDTGPGNSLRTYPPGSWGPAAWNSIDAIGPCGSDNEIVISDGSSTTIANGTENGTLAGEPAGASFLLPSITIDADDPTTWPEAREAIIVKVTALPKSS